ncbi:hypothetical protein [Streptomyces wuyuanensis]|uniref:hypothetical protein n=1 Tax=Streptomyces wuyuanensis TaxID=1196353 RepID=UPI003D71F084
MSTPTWSVLYNPNPPGWPMDCYDPYPGDARAAVGPAVQPPETVDTEDRVTG